MASADIGRPTAAFPDDGVAQGPGLFRDGDGFGTSRRDFTSLSGGGNIMSSVGSDNGPDDQGGDRPLPTQFDEFNADYSSFTLDGLFPVFLTGSESIDSQIMNGQTLFGDSDYFGDFFVNPSGSSPLGLSIVHPLEDRPGRGGSRCSSDGTSNAVHRCQTEEEEDPSFLIAPSAGGAPDADYQPAQQSLNFPGSNPPFGGSGAFPGANPIPSLEMIAAQNSFAMTWPSGVIQGTFPPACCDVTLPVVVGSFAPVSAFVNPGGSLNPDPPSDPPDGGFVVSISVTQSATVPEIPPIAMLLIGFAGLALIGSGRLSRSVRLG
jgi:hypothetical protein